MAECHAGLICFNPSSRMSATLIFLCQVSHIYAISSTRKSLTDTPFGYDFPPFSPAGVQVRDSCSNARYAALFLSICHWARRRYFTHSVGKSQSAFKRPSRIGRDRISHEASAAVTGSNTRTKNSRTLQKNMLQQIPH